MAATVRSSRRRLLAGTGATVPLNYALFVPAASNLAGGSWYLDSNMNLVQHGINVKVAQAIDFNNGGDDLLLDPLNQWYYIKSGHVGSSQRTNCFGFIQTTLSNMTNRFVMRDGTSVTEFEASGTTESYSGGACDLHPAGDVIANFMTGGTLKFWKKNTPSDWSYITIARGAPAVTNCAGLRFSPLGTQVAIARQTGVQPYQVWAVTDRFATWTPASCSFSDATGGQTVAFESETRLVQTQGGTPYINFFKVTGTNQWGTDGTILTDNPSGLVGSHLKNTVNNIRISPDGTIMVTGVNAVTAGGKSHHLFYKVGSAWIYQGQLPGNVAADTVLMNSLRFSSDGRFLFVAFVNNGIQVWSCASGAVAYVKQLALDTGLQNSAAVTASTNHPYFGVTPVGPWEDPAGRSPIDTQIELVSPHYWYKFNEQFDSTVGTDFNPVIRNFGSKKSATGANGNVCVNKTSLSSSPLPRVSGPPSATASLASRFASALAAPLTTQSVSRIDDGSSGTCAFFIKYSSQVATWRDVIDDGAAKGSAGLHFGIYDGKLSLNMGTTGASARDYTSNTRFNDGNWHFVVWRQPADGTGPTLSVDGSLQAVTVNLAAIGSSGSTLTLINQWFATQASGALLIGPSDIVAVQYDLCHVFMLTNTIMTAPQEAAIKSAAGL